MFSEKVNCIFRAYCKSNKDCKNGFTEIDEIKEHTYVDDSGDPFVKSIQTLRATRRKY